MWNLVFIFFTFNIIFSKIIYLFFYENIRQWKIIAKKNDIAMEISPRALARDQMYFRLKFYSLCKEAGLKFSFGSDAHSLDNVGQTWVVGELVKELGITDEDIWLPAINTWQD